MYILLNHLYRDGGVFNNRSYFGYLGFTWRIILEEIMYNGAVGQSKINALS
tara:strand:+ start:333 stop:485 length:153 start_codon:yes stop_codon:yes gene_type:complete